MRSSLRLRPTQAVPSTRFSWEQPVLSRSMPCWSRAVPRRSALWASAAETAGMEAAIAFIAAYAPEHLSIDVRDADATADRIRNAGSIFVGPWAPESAGDYATGANHVLPTGGLARACDPLGVEAFGRYTQVQRLDERGLATIRETVERLATVEGLTAHGHAVASRFRAQ